MLGKHPTNKKPTDPTYSKQWSGVTYAPECPHSSCPKCGSHTHHEGGSHYCPACDDYVPKTNKRCSYS